MTRIAKIFVLVLLASAACSAIAAPKNIILMVSDGWGYNTIAATNAWTGVTQQAYQGADFVHFAMTTYSAGNRGGYVSWGYDPSQAWTDNNTKVNVSYVSQKATDSASAITAMMTGVKNYDNEINWSIDGRPLVNFAELAKAYGKSTGSISTVNWTHATPAGAGAHINNRNDYTAIATEMLTQSKLDVIMGAGHPWYDDNGNLRASPNYGNIGQTNWAKLLDGSYGYTLIQDRAEFQNLATASSVPSKVCGTFKAFSTAQQARSGYSTSDFPFGDPFNPNVPTLAEMTRGAINVLSKNSNGFFILIEGGAVDWANHANQKSRVIEEQDDFNKAVDAVIEWVNNYSSWDDTLLIVTGDHECGILTGPNDAVNITTSSGVLAGMEYNSGNHSNMLIPLYAKGAGSELFVSLVDGIDPVRGYYIDNTDIFRVMTTASGCVPEPGSTMGLVAGISGLGLITLRRKY